MGGKQEIVTVCGGSGFLGSHVAEALTEAGYAVRVFDSRPSPYLAPGQEMIVGEMTDLEQVVEATRGSAYIYNFAAIANITDAVERPLDAIRVNVLGNAHALEAARRHGVRRFVFASSVYVYSRSGSLYRATKQACEQFVETYQECYGVDYSILRYGTLYGRRADERNGIFRLVKQALETGTLHYEGDPDEMREYIHVRDAARLSAKALAPEYRNRHLILTGAERMAVKSLMRMIAEIAPRPVEVTFTPGPPTAGHYVMTPYSYSPKLGYKLVPTDHLDIGQGILDCMAELYESGLRADDAPVLENPGLSQ